MSSVVVTKEGHGNKMAKCASCGCQMKGGSCPECSKKGMSQLMGVKKGMKSGMDKGMGGKGYGGKMPVRSGRGR